MATKMLKQQGDILIEQTQHIPKNAQRVQPSTRGYILAEGEVTGHAHIIAETEEVQLYTLDEILYLVTEGDVDVIHQEHGTVTVPAGTWVVRGVQEYDYTQHEARRVMD